MGIFLSYFLWKLNEIIMLFIKEKLKKVEATLFYLKLLKNQTKVEHSLPIWQIETCGR